MLLRLEQISGTARLAAALALLDATGLAPAPPAPRPLPAATTLPAMSFRNPPCDTLRESETYEPSEDLGPLFEAVQLSDLFDDSKTFVDAWPLTPPSEIVAHYRSERSEDGFDLEHFVNEHFALPASVDVPDASPAETDAAETDAAETDAATPPMQEHLTALWPRLTESPDDQGSARTQGRSSLLPLPHPYVVPGGRFREVYYWDSYFTMLGLVASDQSDLVRGMTRNLAYLAQRYGFIPNGNRSYYLTRPQPPLLSSMVALLAQVDGAEAALEYLGPLRLEYAYWMNGEHHLTQADTAEDHVVRLENGIALNRYWDRKATPRPESFVEDCHLAQQLPEDERPALYRDLRAAAASGWDFSSRWYQGGDSLAATATTSIVPVDLNSLLYHTERTLARLYDADGAPLLADAFREKAERRQAALLRYCWDEERGFFYDYNFRTGDHTDAVTMAAFFPLYYGLAMPEQARRVAERAENELLHAGGFTATTTQSDQQWDTPNGWAPLQWVAVRGLQRYGLDALAGRAEKRWIALNRDVYERTGRMVEKYNVVDTDLRAGGGEYPAQDGFGWTNGVALALLRDQRADLYGADASPNGSVGAENSAPDTLAFRTLAQGVYGAYESSTRQNLVFEQENEFASFWDDLHGGMSEAPAVPSVNFAGGARVVVAILGERRSGGYGVEVSAVKRDGDHATVRFTETVPDEGGAVTSAITYPYHVVAVEEAPPEGFTFETERQANEC